MFSFKKRKDEHIQKDVMDELKWDPSVIATNISVSVTDGVAVLRGSVPHHFEKKCAVEAAQRVSGVRGVADELAVEMLRPDQRRDEDIAEAALNALRWHYSVPEGIKVIVENGWVTLRGEADWEFERKAAEEVIGPLMGVRGITNEITLRNMAEAPDVRERIEQALRRAAETEGERINIEVKGNHVTLSGRVRSLSEKDDVLRAAWNAPGVLTVADKLSLAA